VGVPPELSVLRKTIAKSAKHAKNAKK